MAYLIYTQSDETLETMLERTWDDCRWLHIQVANARKRGDKRLAGLVQRKSMCERRAAQIELEIEWREDPTRITESMERAGKRLIYTTGGADEWETEEAALRTAKFIHTVNEINRYDGADGSYVPDLVPPERMVQAIFVQEESNA